MEIKRIDILGVGIDALNISTAVKYINLWALRKEKRVVICRDSRGLVYCKDDPFFYKLHKDADLITPDGVPLVWLLRWFGAKNVERVCGPDLMHAVCAETENTPLSHFFYGSTDDTVEKLVGNLKLKYPSLNVAGYHAPPFRDLTPSEDQEHCELINNSKADILWVGLGCPKQEYWIGEHAEIISSTIIISVGAAFDWVAGTVPRAPLFIQFSGFEWLFRLLVEPARLWRRTFIDNRRFLVLIIVESIKKLNLQNN